MNQHVLQNYFLRAGASYRRSAEWQEDFLDSGGHSKVLRSGRFGVEILAAFILGPIISVKTRHYSEPMGLSFSAGLETDPIDVRYCKMPVGTEIEIKIPHTKSFNPISMFQPTTTKQCGSLLYHLYVLSSPSMQLLLNGRKVNRKEQWPACGEDPLPQAWRRFKPAGFKEVQWRYEQEGNCIACNGIVVSRPGPDPATVWGFSEENRNLNKPTLSVFDPDGNLPLTLDRTAIGRLPFEKQLIRDIYRDVAASCLVVHAMNDGRDFRLRKPWHVIHPAFDEKTSPAYLFLTAGFTIADSTLAALQDLHTINFLSFPFYDKTLPSPPSPLEW